MITLCFNENGLWLTFSLALLYRSEFDGTLLGPGVLVDHLKPTGVS